MNDPYPNLVPRLRVPSRGFMILAISIALFGGSLILYGASLGFGFIGYDENTVLLGHPNLYNQSSLLDGVREILVGKVRRCIDAGLLAGDPVDVAHVLLALAQGLAIQEAGRWLGTSATSINRRWDVGVQAVLAGFGR